MTTKTEMPCAFDDLAVGDRFRVTHPDPDDGQEYRKTAESEFVNTIDPKGGVFRIKGPEFRKAVWCAKILGIDDADTIVWRLEGTELWVVFDGEKFFGVDGRTEDESIRYSALYETIHEAQAWCRWKVKG